MSTASEVGTWLESEIEIAEAAEPEGDDLDFDEPKAGAERLVVCIPAAAAVSQTAFREWLTSGHGPEVGRWAWIDGEIIVDMSAEHIDSHLAVKTTMAIDLGLLVRELNNGQLFADGLLVSSEEAEVSNEPDLTFARWETIESGRARFVPSKSKPDDSMEIYGAPDVVIEIVSDSSVGKDRRKLRRNYHRAGIPEYWLLDARGTKEIKFEILRQAAGGYQRTPAVDGWVASEVFGRRFRLERERNRVGRWSYTLRHEPIPAV